MPNLPGLKFIVFFILAGATFWLGSWFERYVPVGPELLHNPGFSENLAQWQLAGPPSAAVIDPAGGLRLQATDSEKSISVGQSLADPGRFRLLRLAADLRSEKVIAGAKGWERARLLLRCSNDTGALWSIPHQVATLQGDQAWQHYAKTFRVPDDVLEARVIAQLAHASGTLWIKNLSLQEVALKPLFIYGRITAFVLWGGFIFWLLLSYLRAGCTRLLKGAILASVAGILLGTLVPGEVKNHVSSELRAASTEVVSQLVTLESPHLSLWKKYRPDPSKVGHFVLFAVFAFCLARSHRQQRRATLLLDLLLLASATELLQFFIEGRSPLFSDLLIDLAGAALGVLVVLVRRVAGGE